MSTILPSNEKIRKAVKWVSDHLQEARGDSATALAHQAAERFDLNPQESDFLLHFYKDAPKK